MKKKLELKKTLIVPLNDGPTNSHNRIQTATQGCETFEFTCKCNPLVLDEISADVHSPNGQGDK